MKKINSYTVTNSGLYGSLVEFTVTYDEAPDSVTIEIYDQYGTQQVDDSMDLVTDATKTFEYTYDTSGLQEETQYLEAKVIAAYGTANVINIFTFSLIDSYLD